MSISKTSSAIALFLMLTITISIIPLTLAHDPAWNIVTYSFISVSPNPVGVGQTANVNFWVNIPPPTASGQFGDRWHNMTVKVTKPDGTTETLGPFTSDATGGTVTTYTPTALGNYTFQMFFGGQTLTGENLAPGSDPAWIPEIGDYYKPSSSNVFKLTVQQEPIGYSPSVPLPTNYWTRPIYGENNNWYSIAGNWLGLGGGAYGFAMTGLYNCSGNYNPYTTAPNTAHVLWTKPVAFGGLIGGEYGNSQTSNYYSAANYEPKFAPIIINGILYYTKYPGSFANPAGWEAVDLHTGQTIWTKNTTEVLLCGQILNYISPNQYGGTAYLWAVPMEAASFEAAGGDMSMYDAMTGNYILTITSTPNMVMGPLSIDDSGNLIFHYVNYTDYTLNMWNSTRCINLAVPNSYGGPPVADNWMWRPPQNAVIDWGLGIQWSAPLATDIAGTPIIDYENGLYGLGVVGLNSGVLLLTETWLGTAWGYQPGWQIEAGYSADRGEQLWITNRTQAPNSIVLVGGFGWAMFTMGSGVYVEVTQSTFTVNGYSLTTGQKLWGPVALPNVNPYSALGISTQVANGTIYIYTYGGDVYAINMLTGAVIWEYHSRPANLESPYGIWPLWTFELATVADGKIFVPEGHEYSPPLFHDAQQLALNLTDGSLVWSIDAFDVTSAPAISDGIMVNLNAYDNQLYGMGKGPTKVTVTAPSVGVTTSSSIVISGTVNDISAGSLQQAVAANFPNGLPCVSDASMTSWMEYVYMQQARPSNATGVQVSLDAIDPNNNFIHLGTATSDTSGTFGFEWKTPDVPGKYTIIATFAGSESYYASYAETYAVVTEAPPASPTPTPAAPLPPIETYFVVATVAIIIAIAIVGILMLRKK